MIVWCRWGTKPLFEPILAMFNVAYMSAWMNYNIMTQTCQHILQTMCKYWSLYKIQVGCMNLTHWHIFVCVKEEETFQGYIDTLIKHSKQISDKKYTYWAREEITCYFERLYPMLLHIFKKGNGESNFIEWSENCFKSSTMLPQAMIYQCTHVFVLAKGNFLVLLVPDFVVRKVRCHMS